MSASSYLLSRWRGEAPLTTVFWRDMIMVGSMLNVIAAFGGLLLLAAGAPTAAVLAVYFSPLPWNIFLFLSVWRSAERASPSEATMARFGATIWLVIAAVL
jgi:hypothetical protein